MKIKKMYRVYVDIDFDICHKLTTIMEKYNELTNMIRSLNENEYKLLIHSLEKSLEETND